MMTHGRSCLLVFASPVRTAHGRSRPLVFQFPLRTVHGRSCPLVFQFLVRTVHGRSCPLVFQSLVRTEHGLSHSRWCSSLWWGPYMVAHACWCSSLRWGLLMVTHSSTYLNFLFQLPSTPHFRKGGRKGEDNVTDRTIVMSRFEHLTTFVIVKCYVLTITSKYIVMYKDVNGLLVVYLFQVLGVFRKF
jgi:hypothetical protein